MSSRVIGVAHSGEREPAVGARCIALRGRRSADLGPPHLRSRCRVRDLCHLAPVVAGMRRRSSGGSPPGDGRGGDATSASASSEAIRSVLGLADPDQDSARERDPQLSRRLDRLAAGAPDAWSASRRGRFPSAVRRSTPASAPATRSPRAAGRGRRGRGRQGWCAGGAPARARARTPRRRRRRSPRARRRRAARRPRD